MTKYRLSCVWLPLLLAAVSVSAWAKRPVETLETTLDSDYLTIHPAGQIASYTIVVQGPSGRFEYTFSGDETAFIDTFTPEGVLLADGLYSYQITAAPLQKRVRGLDIPVEIDRESMVSSGSFTIDGGEFVMPTSESLGLDGPIRVSGKGGASDQDDPTRDQVFLDDLIVVGSACIGQDCANGESFGFDTLRLKENNLRIKFQDTSVSASFPTNDWQITANDSTNGGQSKFSIDDIDGGRTPFTIEASAPTNSIYVDSSGRVGLGKKDPVVELHVTNGDSPTLRLEQDGSSGFTAQTWDVAGNETNFFVRDATNGSEIPFKIKPGADDNALFIAANNNIGFQNGNPSASLHLRTTNGTAQLKIEDTQNASDSDPLIYLSDWSQTKMTMENTFSGEAFDIFAGTNGLNFSNQITNDAEITIKNDNTIRMGQNLQDHFVMAPNGNVTMGQDLTVNGTFSNPSDVNMKEEFEAVDPAEVLDKLVALPIMTWEYARDEADARHMGVMSQDFFAAFGLGGDDRYLTSIDPDGVAMAAIQGLNQKVETKDADKDARIAELEQKNRDLADRLAELEALVQSLVDDQQ